MTDLEISKALALAIGHKEVDVFVTGECQVVWDYGYNSAWRKFDYKDWNVIGPIAEKFDCFPVRDLTHRGAWASLFSKQWIYADAPQKAIAMAVIGANK